MDAKRSTAILSLTILILFGIVLGPVFAQIPIDPMPPEPPWPPIEVAPVQFPVTLELHQVDAEIDGPVASVTVKQVFRNDSMNLAEGTYIFPLPADAAPSSFQMTIDGKVVEGSLYDRNEARAIYEEIVRNLRDPALLEWLDRGMFQVSVFPIPAGEERTVELTYEQPVAQDGALYNFRVPLRAYVPGASPAEQVVINVELVNQEGLRTLYSPSHEVDIARDGESGATIGFEGMGKDTQSDFVLYFGTNDSVIGANLLSNKPAGEDGYFMLLVAPSLLAAEEEVVQRDLVIVLDVSGSMQGTKIEQAREAVRYVVERLNEGDRFNLISFSTGVRLWESGLQEVDDASQRAADEWIQDLEATGSTNIDRALTEALSQLDEESNRPAYVLFMTDGLPTQGETDIDQIIENAQDNRPDDRSLRLFTFGVGYDVNTDLLDALSAEMGGRSTYVKPDEDIEAVVADFYDQIGKPVLADVELDLLGETVVDEVFPDPLPDLFAGEQLVVVGRYREGGEVDVVLNGEVNGEPHEYLYPNQNLVEQGGEPFVARLWATRKIGALLDQIRREGADPELVEAVVDLSLEYGIVSPYTSYLVLEPGMKTDEFGAPAAEAPGNLRERAYDLAGAAMAESAAAPAAGEVAVYAAEARSTLREAEIVVAQEQVRFIEGKTFVQSGWVEGEDGKATALWVDTAYEENEETEQVAFGSDRYFELVEDATVARWLSLSPEMIVVLVDGSAIRVTTTGAAD